jgi:hypothetical protein
MGRSDQTDWLEVGKHSHKASEYFGLSVYKRALAVKVGRVSTCGKEASTRGRLEKVKEHFL